MNTRKTLFITLLITTGVFLILGAYKAYQKFLSDRQSAMNYTRPRQRVFSNTQPTQQREVTTYTAEELEELRKKGQVPKNQPYIPPAQTANDAAVQRTLRTLEEINRINEMNRKMQDQQRRMQERK